MELFSKNPGIDFIGKWKVAMLLSIALVAYSIYLWVSLGEAKYGVDFKGGFEIVAKVPGATSDAIRDSLKDAGLGDVAVQSFEVGSEEYSIRMGGAGDSKPVREQVLSALKKSFGEAIEILKMDYVGPTVGRELRTKAVTATALGIIGLLLYITFRFEFAFALGAVVAVFHDVIIALGVYLAAGHTINMGTIAAALTILGYSVNDTIVIFDRVREEVSKRKDFVLSEIMNECMNLCLGRTIITSFLTWLSVLALLLFGGGAISDLSLYLFAGIICGSYSTIYIASPVVIGWEMLRRPKAAETVKA